MGIYFVLMMRYLKTIFYRFLMEALNVICLEVSNVNCTVARVTAPHMYLLMKLITKRKHYISIKTTGGLGHTVGFNDFERAGSDVNV